MKKKRKQGRPKRYPNGRNTIVFSVSKTMADEFRATAAVEGMTNSDFFRHIFKFWKGEP